MSEQKITALVTGASSGLGAEFCRQLAARCDVIIAVARRAEPMRELANELRVDAELHVIEADLVTIEGVTRTIEALRQLGPVNYLVNNAGFGSHGDFDDNAIAQQQEMVALHINATLSLCRAAIPFMRGLGGGNIINVSSLAAFLPQEGLAVYGASKAFLNVYSLSLEAELADSGIHVQCLCPGFTRTGFHGTTALADLDLSGIPAVHWMQASEVVATSLAALEGKRVLVVPGDMNRLRAQEGLQAQMRDLGLETDNG